MTEKQAEYEVEKPKPKTISVKVIRTIGKTQLVEWQEKDIPRRAIVPTQDKYTQDDLNAGMQYGERWDEIKLQADSKELARLLYQNDIWTKEDAAHKTRTILGILAKVYGADLAAILKGGK